MSDIAGKSTESFSFVRMQHRPLRVCHLAYTFYEYDGRVKRYVETLLERGDRVDVIALREAGASQRAQTGALSHFRIQRRAENERGRPSVYLLKLVWFCVQSNILLTLLQLQRRYDVVHVHNIPEFLVSSAWLPKLMGARIILDIHDVVPELYAGKFGRGEHSAGFRLLLLVERLCCKFADCVVIANHLWHAKLTSRSVPAHKCTTIMNYPDLEVFRPAPTSAKEGRPFVLLYPGSLNVHQGLDIAIQAFALVHRQMPGAEFHIYGKGPARERLMQMAADTGVAEAVRFMDPIGVQKIATVIASASVGIVPKRADGFGNEAFSTKTLEFMACGVPLIVARTKIDAYYFNDQLVNFFVPGDSCDLARVLLGVYTHPEEQKERVRAAVVFANEFSWQRRYQDYRGLVDSLAICEQSAPA